jgi:hypothetical protein
MRFVLWRTAFLSTPLSCLASFFVIDFNPGGMRFFHGGRLRDTPYHYREDDHHRNVKRAVLSNVSS